MYRSEIDTTKLITHDWHSLEFDVHWISWFSKAVVFFCVKHILKEMLNPHPWGEIPMQQTPNFNEGIVFIYNRLVREQGVNFLLRCFLIFNSMLHWLFIKLDSLTQRRSLRLLWKYLMANLHWLHICIKLNDEAYI